jgi:hypothetical protein
LQPRARDSICEQCHLEGDNRILNPGKRWSDFLPGDELEKTMVAYVLEEQGQEPKAVGQVEQLAESRCATQSRGKLWCGTCHNPHGAHPRGQVECVSCHMPRRASEYAHVAVTDHRIVRQAAKMPQSRLRGTQSLKAWIEPPLSLRRRDLALANLRAGVKLHMPELVRSGLKLMTDQEADSDLLAAACEATHDVALCRRSARADPRSAERAMALGSALAATGELDGAETELIRAIDLDPSLKHAYLELWTVYDRQHKSDRMKATAERFLVWNPSNILFRLLLRNLLNTDLF